MKGLKHTVSAFKIVDLHVHMDTGTCTHMHLYIHTCMYPYTYSCEAMQSLNFPYYIVSFAFVYI